MAKRMDEDEEFYRIRVEVEYWIRYHSYNPNWDHTKPTTGDHDGSNPMYVQHDEDTHVHFVTYCGPFGTPEMATKQTDKFIKHYENSDSYKGLRIVRGDIEVARWEKA